jgi:DNA-binding response OmpR family regulator
MDVLLVEDEPLVREMVTEWLEDAGLRVAAAANAEVALALTGVFDKSPPPVLVADAWLGPNSMDGITLAAELRHRWPGLGVVTMTEDEAALTRWGAPAPRERRLVKPFSPVALVRAVRELTARPVTSAR